MDENEHLKNTVTDIATFVVARVNNVVQSRLSTNDIPVPSCSAPSAQTMNSPAISTNCTFRLPTFQGKHFRKSSRSGRPAKKTCSKSASFIRTIVCIPYEYASFTPVNTLDLAIKFPRGETRSLLSASGLITKMELSTLWSEEEVTTSISDLFLDCFLPSRNKLKFCFLRTLPGLRVLRPAKLNELFRWDGAGVFSLGRGNIYILADKEHSLACSIKDIDATNKQPTTGQTKDGVQVLSHQDVGVKEDNEEVSSLYSQYINLVDSEDEDTDLQGASEVSSHCTNAERVNNLVQISLSTNDISVPSCSAPSAQTMNSPAVSTNCTFRLPTFQGKHFRKSFRSGRPAKKACSKSASFIRTIICIPYEYASFTPVNTLDLVIKFPRGNTRSLLSANGLITNMEFNTLWSEEEVTTSISDLFLDCFLPSRNKLKFCFLRTLPGLRVLKPAKLNESFRWDGAGVFSLGRGNIYILADKEHSLACSIKDIEATNKQPTTGQTKDGVQVLSNQDVGVEEDNEEVSSLYSQCIDLVDSEDEDTDLQRASEAFFHCTNAERVNSLVQSRLSTNDIPVPVPSCSAPSAQTMNSPAVSTNCTFRLPTFQGKRFRRSSRSGRPAKKTCSKSASFIRTIVCIPYEYASFTPVNTLDLAIKFPRGETRSLLSANGLIANMELNTLWSEDEVTKSISDLFLDCFLPSRNELKFCFLRTLPGLRVLKPAKVNELFRWDGTGVFSLGRGNIYILADKEHSLACSIKDIEATNKQPTTGQTKDGVQVLSDENVGVEEGNEEVSSLYSGDDEDTGGVRFYLIC